MDIMVNSTRRVPSARRRKWAAPDEDKVTIRFEVSVPPQQIDMLGRVGYIAVVGSLPELGRFVLPKRLTRAAGNAWRLEVPVPQCAVLTYTYLAVRN